MMDISVFSLCHAIEIEFSCATFKQRDNKAHVCIFSLFNGLWFNTQTPKYIFLKQNIKKKWSEFGTMTLAKTDVFAMTDIF